MSEPSRRTLRVCALYPDLMNIYADRGNLIVLERRCSWRGIGFELTSSSLGEELDDTAAELYYMGGGQDRDQRLCAEDLLANKRSALHGAAERGALVLGVCGGYQLLGHSYTLDAEEIEGVGLLDVRTVREDGPRLIGNVAIELTLPGLEGPRYWPASRTTAGAPDWTPDNSPSDGSSGATATTAEAASREPFRRTRSAPTSTGRCCPRTSGSPTG